MADNVLLNSTVFTKAFLLLLKNQLVAGRLVDGQFKNEVTDENGLTVSVKRPPRFVAQDGEALSLQPIVAGSANVKVDKYKNVHIDVGDLEHVRDFDGLMENETMRAAAGELANTIDQAVHEKFKEFASSVGTPGTVIGSALQFNAVHTRLMEQSVPNSDISAVVDFADGEAIRGNLIGTNIDGINRTALEKIKIPILSEINLFATQGGQSIVAGTREIATGLVNGAAQNVNYRTAKDTATQVLNVDTFGATVTFKVGDTFTVAGLFAVNPRSRQALPYLKQFVIKADAVAVAGAVALTISPPMIVGGTSDGVGATPTIVNTAFQTVSAIPADGALITFTAAAGDIDPVRVAFHKRAISLVSAKLRAPMSDTHTFMTDPETGISIRHWKGSDISTGRHIHRFDTIFGVDMMDIELGARVNGS